MYSGFPLNYPPVCVGETTQSCQEMLNLQKHYHTDMSQYRTEYMKNVFGLIPRHPPIYPNAGQVMGATTMNTENTEGENHTTGGVSESVGSTQQCREGTEQNRKCPTFKMENSNMSKNDKTLSPNSGQGRSENVNISNDCRCDVCGDIIQTAYKPVRCADCQKYFPDSVYHSPVKLPNSSHVKLLYNCEVCEKKFVSMTTLKTHGRVHSGERPYQCPICDKTFVYEGNMKTHIRTHTGEKPFTCDQCGKSFSQSGTLKKHLRMHSGEKPFKCEFCEKTFAYSENLIPHRRVHSGDKPFECELCKKAFSQPGSLKGHLKTIHGISEKKKESCQPLIESESDSEKTFDSETSTSNHSVLI